MNPISLAMDGLLAVLLLTAVAVGVRLNGKLRLLRDSQGQFVRAVGDLDAAAGRAEAGLQALRAATEEAHDALLTRIETARGLVPKLDRAAEESAAAVARLEEGVRAADAAGRRAQLAADAAARGATDLVSAQQAMAPPAAARSRALEADVFDEDPILAVVPRRAARGEAPAPRPVAEPIPFPVPERGRPDRGLSAAMRAVERIVEAETVSETPTLDGVVASTTPAAAGGDRLARFVARRRSARA